MSQRCRELLRKLRKNDQKGFTLIELLVVISIIGILAAVVTMSMVGVTQLAQQRAAKAELQTVQLAIDTMANEQQVPADSICPAVAPSPAATPSGTKHMDEFPPNSQPSATASPPTGFSVTLYPRYLRTKDTNGTYWCDADGTVHQNGFSPP